MGIVTVMRMMIIWRFKKNRALIMKVKKHWISMRLRCGWKPLWSKESKLSPSLKPTKPKQPKRPSECVKLLIRHVGRRRLNSRRRRVLRRKGGNKTMNRRLFWKRREGRLKRKSRCRLRRGRLEQFSRSREELRKKQNWEMKRKDSKETRLTGNK